MSGPAIGPVVVGLSAVVLAIRAGELVALTTGGDGVRALPSGAFDPQGPPTFELALRGFVAAQTGFALGYVEQLYTFGDKGRAAPLADAGAGAPAGARVISVGYLGLATSASADAAWRPWTRAFPWEDWRRGRPAAHAALEPHLRGWMDASPGREARAAALFALDGLRWNEERVLERYELLYEAGLVAEALRDRGEDPAEAPPPSPATFGEPMASDHRRILATGLGRLRGKLKYRPVVFELLGASFTLSELQRTVEAISGVALHKPNFRRMLERTGLVEELDEMEASTGGRPARRFRFRRAEAALAPALGFTLPLLREG